jgi:RimJ/RimL family protein N-acetyltransferase
MSQQLFVEELAGRHVRLEPLSTSHVDGLFEASQEDRSNYTYTEVPDTRDEVERYVHGLLADWEAGLVVPFAQVSVEQNRVVGATRFLTLRWRGDAGLPFAVEIGGTWLAASAQRTAINTEAKLLLMRHAFETWHVARVDLKTDARNERSWAAILRLGCTFEGVLRQWQPSLVVGEEDLFRDSAIFSVVASEWPTVENNLAAKTATTSKE